MLYRYRNSDIAMSAWGFGGGFGAFGRKRGLRPLVVMILQRGPKNGAEVMDAMESMSQGWWRPSPGSVYPLLEELAKDGIARRREDGRYELTTKGKDETAWGAGWFTGRAKSPPEVIEEIGHYVAYLEDLATADRAPFAAERERIRQLSQRLQSLAK
jgi:DNA-binding PadR family transcriptional regulator